MEFIFANCTNQNLPYDEIKEMVKSAFGAISSPKPEWNQKKYQLKGALEELNPFLKDTPWDYAEIASQEGLSPEKAQKKYPSITLIEDRYYFEIIIGEEVVVVNLPLVWLGEETTQKLFTDIWQCLEVIEKYTGFKTYSVSQDSLIDLEHDFEQCLTPYKEFLQLRDSMELYWDGESIFTLDESSLILGEDLKLRLLIQQVKNHWNMKMFLTADQLLNQFLSRSQQEPMIAKIVLKLLIINSRYTATSFYEDFQVHRSIEVWEDLLKKVGLIKGRTLGDCCEW